MMLEACETISNEGLQADMAIRAALASAPKPSSTPQADSQPAPTYKDSTPELHVGDSAFESWYSTYNPAHKSDKQRARDAYAAGMGDPLVMAAPAAVAGQCEDAIELLGKYKELCEEIKRGDSYHIGRIDAAISVLAQAAPVAQGDAQQPVIPSDAEIDAQWRESVEKHETTAAFVRDFARTVLAKWGAPPQISGFTVPQADSQPAPVRDYPPLPDFETVEQHIYGACRRYITQDMLVPIHNLIRDVIDADRAARAKWGMPHEAISVQANA